MTQGKLPQDTLEKYRSTLYHVDAAAGPFVLDVGHYSAELASLHAEQAVNSSAFITAFNPRGAAWWQDADSAQENARRQRNLEDELTAAGIAWLAGRGAGPAADWPPEESVLALGLSREAACALGRKYEQNAILFCGADAVPELVLLVD